MTPKQQTRRDEFDRKVAELCADPLLKISGMADRLNVSETTLEVSLRRQRISRKLGRPRKAQG